MRILLAAAAGSLAAACSVSVSPTPSFDQDAAADGSTGHPRGDGGDVQGEGGHPGSDGGVNEAAADATIDATDPGTAPPMELSNVAGDTFETETQIAVAPNGTIAVMWIQATATGYAMGYRFSTDHGATFEPARQITPPAGLNGADPALAVDAQGNFYASLMGVHYGATAADYSRLYVAKAPAGSTTFGTPVEASDPSIAHILDHPKILVTAKGTIAVVYADFGTSTSGSSTKGLAATSTDGTTWKRSTIIDENAYANLFWLCEGAGALYVTYLEGTDTTFGVAVRKSTNEGGSWSTSKMVDTTNVAGLDPGCVAHGNDVWVGYGTSASAPADGKLDLIDGLKVAHSSDGTATFDATRMDALDTKATKAGTLPLLVREEGGALDAVWIGGAAEDDAAGSVRYARATGATFGPSIEVDSPVKLDLSRTTTTWLGDYFGSVSVGRTIYFAYPQNSSGATHIFFRRMALP